MGVAFKWHLIQSGLDESAIEKELKKTGKEFDEVKLTELDSLWEDSKKLS